MTDRTLFALAFLALLGLAACTAAMDTAITAPSPLPDAAGWRLVSGKAPTKAEFAALAATCEAKGGATDTCLAELGLKKAP